MSSCDASPCAGRKQQRGAHEGDRAQPPERRFRADAAAHEAALGSNCMTTVLLVDDDSNALCALKELVGQEGYRVHTAANGALALRSAMAERPDVVVTDCMMPEMDGVDLSRAMQHERLLADVPVVLVSALVTPPPDLHAAGFLRKPFAVAQLLEILGRLVTP
jgi:CheY-like chemotaxis protein